jgi:putative endonuclease
VPAASNTKEKKSLRRETTKGLYFMSNFFTYILECSDKSLYVGCTNNLEKRLEQHNSSKWGAHYTKIRRPVILKYSENFKTLKKARRREIEIKGWRRSKKLQLINT